jgi:hypothetical protein
MHLLDLPSLSYIYEQVSFCSFVVLLVCWYFRVWQAVGVLERPRVPGLRV